MGATLVGNSFGGPLCFRRPTENWPEEDLGPMDSGYYVVPPPMGFRSPPVIRDGR